jgi:hypothetical protein
MSTARQVSWRILSPRPRYTSSYHCRSISSGVPVKPWMGSGWDTSLGSFIV